MFEFDWSVEIYRTDCRSSVPVAQGRDSLLENIVVCKCNRKALTLELFLQIPIA